MPNDSQSDELTLQIDGKDGEAPRLLRISRPFGPANAALVRVREWSGRDWTGAPRDIEVATEVLYRELERDVHARRQLSRELYQIRLWLDGRAI